MSSLSKIIIPTAEAAEAPGGDLNSYTHFNNSGV
jgi:hypothetical protein